MEENLRLFAAIDLPGDLKRLIGERLPELAGKYPVVRWVKSENLHLTLKFLGHVSVSKFEDVCGALEKACSRARPIPLRISGCGAFPSEVKGRVFWLGLEGDVSGAVELASMLESNLEKMGFERDERPFRPHVTLGRMKKPMPCRNLVIDLQRVLEEIGPLEFTATEVVLFRSILAREGPTYLSLMTFRLGRG